ncbi:MAG: HipA N-terminal domain-containing protein [Bdellovibrionota bacterium]
MRSGKVFVSNQFAGRIYESDEGFIFAYDQNYLRIENATPVSLTMPLQSDEYKSKTMFPFFDGLIPEGWLLSITQKHWKIQSNDRMALLLTVCRDCIGNVHIENEEENI